VGGELFIICYISQVSSQLKRRQSMYRVSIKKLGFGLKYSASLGKYSEQLHIDISKKIAV